MQIHSFATWQFVLGFVLGQFQWASHWSQVFPLYWVLHLHSPGFVQWAWLILQPLAQIGWSQRCPIQPSLQLHELGTWTLSPFRNFRSQLPCWQPGNSMHSSHDEPFQPFSHLKFRYCQRNRQIVKCKRDVYILHSSWCSYWLDVAFCMLEYFLKMF